MKKIALLIFCASFAAAVLAQDKADTRRMEFSLRISNSAIVGRTDVEKLFFGDRMLYGNKNTLVEFFVAPSFYGSYGFRTVKNASDSSYVIEVKDIPNYKEVVDSMRKQYPAPRTTAAKNREAWQKQREESLNLFEVQTQAFAISDSLAKKIHEKFVSSIDNFDPGRKKIVVNGNVRKVEEDIVVDGEYVTFRCAVDDDIVKTLTIHQPVRESGKLSDICKQLIKDLQNGQFSETEYLDLFR